MKLPHLGAFLISLALIAAIALLVYPNGDAGISLSQDANKSLDIERYANEPLELIELKIGEQPVKDKVTIKFRRNDEGLDNVKFNDSDGWYKRVWVKLRNVSGRPIQGVSSHLYFQPQDTRTLFSLPLVGSTLLKQGVLDPGAEIILTVSDQSWGLTADILMQHKVDPNLASVKFAIDIVRFSDGSQWSRGHLLRPDSGNPNKWIRIEKGG